MREGETPPGANGRPHRLSDRYRRLVDHYFTDARFNQSEAARLTGYKWPTKIAWKLFNKPAVKAEVDRRHRVAQERYDITYESIIQEMAKIGFMNIGDFMDFDEKTGEFVGVNLRKEMIEKLSALDGDLKLYVRHDQGCDSFTGTWIDDILDSDKYEVLDMESHVVIDVS